MTMKVIQGLLVDCRQDWSLRAEEGVLVIENVKIIQRTSKEHLDKVLKKFNISANDVIHLSNSEFIMPGLIDTHTHASQFPNIGIGMELTLLDWLKTYTFPTEAGLAKNERAAEVYSRCVRSTLDAGTTTAVYFATIHKDTSVLLADICSKMGQRAFVGKVNMDRNSPENYCEDTEDSLADTVAFVDSVARLGSELVTPMITPRFVPSCSRQLMTDLGRLASKRGLGVQTHLSENRPECEWVKELEPDCDNYTQVYLRCGLLGPRTILAHCVHLAEEEVSTLREAGAGVAHCPNSNFSLKSGVCDVRRLQKAGVKVGLGTDASGGFSPTILNAMRTAVTASNSLTFDRPNYSPLGFSDVIYLATRGGASLLDMTASLGALEPGMMADILRVDMDAHSNTRLFGTESFKDIVSKFVFLADDRNIRNVWVAGKLVKQ